MKKNIWISLLLCSCLTIFGFTQDGKDTIEVKAKGYEFTDVINLDITSIKDQNRSGTCWAFSANSFFEQEMLRMGKSPVDFSEMFIVHHCYVDKAKKYVRMHGYLNFNAGGAFHDVLYVMKNYGIVPESVYSGLNYGEKKHVHNELNAILKSMVKTIVSNKNKKLSSAWKNAIEGTLNAYLGKLPATFDYEDNSFTPKTFLSDYCGLNPDDYVAISSYMHHPFYTQFVLEVPDNWLGQYFYNVPLNEMMTIIDNALEKGYSIAWASDISERGFSSKKHGVAIVPEVDRSEMDDKEIDKWEALSEKEKEKQIYTFDKPGKEKTITQELRQEAFDNFHTTDDHGMHIYGTAVDQNGTKYYKVKNSWGKYNKFDGIFYASVPFVAYKTINILVHKDTLPRHIKNKLGIK